MTDSTIIPGPSSSSDSGNTISLSIPTNLLGGTGAAGMLNFNYNFGPTVAQQTTQADNFLTSAMASQTAFLGSSIAGTQQFLSNTSQPIVASVVQNTTAFGGLIPSIISSLGSLFKTTVSTQGQIANAGLAASAAVSQASIAASQSAASSSGGGCFITTAVCDATGLPDDNAILTTLREFRDRFMLAHAEGKRLVAQYYASAPGYVDAINRRFDAKKIYLRMLRFFIVPAVIACRDGDNEKALALYAALVDYARVKAHAY